ncbi:MAG: hypothetical protein ACQEWV_29270 [Bacillota bacterium]
MVKTIKLTMLCLIVFLTACQSTNNQTFYGNGENWEVELKITQVDRKESEAIMLRYKGTDVDSFEKFEFKVEAPNWSWGMGDIQLNKEGLFVEENPTLNEKNTNKTDNITIEIKWNEQTEIIPLSTK